MSDYFFSPLNKFCFQTPAFLIKDKKKKDVEKNKKVSILHHLSLKLISPVYS